VKFAEQFYPELIPHISPVRSPQQIMGSLIRSWYVKSMQINPADVYSVSIMPCTSKKFEAQRFEMSSKGIADIDTVLTTREFARLIRLHGIDMDHLDPEPADEPMNSMSSAGKLFGVSGGSLEALLRTIYYKYTGKELTNYRLSKLRMSRNVKEMSLKIGKKDINIAAVSGMANAVKLLEEVRAKRKKIDIIEVMACQGGCVNGGGQPIVHDENAVKNRSRAIYDFDSKEILKVAHKNVQVQKLYDELLDFPLSPKACELLHTSYTAKEII
jgi:iron only hydrogenase large subunit-like protein